MKVTYNWIKEFVPINASPVDVAKKLTSAGMEVEEIIYQIFDTITCSSSLIYQKIKIIQK